MELSDINSRLDQAIDLLVKLKAELSSEVPTLPKEAQALLDAGYCLFCKQKIGPDERAVRGCHEKHARRIARSIEAGELTEYEAISRGIFAPQATAGRKKLSILEEIEKFDFWFADAITAANLIESSDNESIRFLAESLIAQEDAILRSKMEFLSEMKRRGIRPNRT